MATAYEEPVASQFDIMRDARRKEHLITYDCFHCIALPDDKARCELGHNLVKQAPRISIYQVLKGWSFKVCQTCENYND